MPESPRRQKAVAIVYPWPALDTVPSLCNAAVMLQEAGYGVELFTAAAPDYIPPSLGSGIEITVLESPNRIGGLLPVPAQSWDRQAGNPALRIVRRTAMILYRALVILNRLLGKPVRRLVSWRWSLKVWADHRRRPYVCFIGVDPGGLARAKSLSALIRAPIAYYSLELLLSAEITTDEDRSLKEQEVALSRDAPFVVIQDRERAVLLSEDNGIPLDRMVLVPNSPLGPARRTDSRYWHNRFGLEESARVALHAGSLEIWTGLLEIMANVPTWPQDWVLIVHSKYRVQQSEYAERVVEAAIPGRTFLSLEPVSRQEYDELVNAADAGLAFYVPQGSSTYTQANIQTVGLSSGKVAYFLRSGVPVIVSDRGLLGEVITNERCGWRVDDAGEIGPALRRVSQNYDEYSRNACQAFDRLFDFRRSFAAVLDAINAIAIRPSSEDRRTWRSRHGAKMKD